VIADHGSHNSIRNTELAGGLTRPSRQKRKIRRTTSSAMLEYVGSGDLLSGACALFLLRGQAANS